MSTETPAPAPPPGFFGSLAERQLAPRARPAVGSLRPWLPSSFDSPSSVPEFEPPRPPIRSDATDIPEQNPAPRRLERRDVEYQETQSPLPPAKTVAFTESNETGLRPPVNRDFTTELIQATPTRPVDHVEQAHHGPPDRRDAPGTMMARSVPPRAFETNLQTERQLHTHERVVTIERRAQTERQVSSLPLQPQSAQARDVTPTPRVAPRVSLPAASFRRQRETEPKPTIEIHIGRLEVRAQTAPAARPAPEATDSPDQRLAAYLRRRGNGARS